MRHQDIARRKQTLDALFAKISTLSHDLELQSHWARYLCVLTSGFIEESVRTIYVEYARKQAGPHVGNFVAGQLHRFQNAKMERIIELAKQFNPTWEHMLRSSTADELKDAIDSIVARRHEIAHGGSSNMTYHQIREYYERAVKVIELIETQCS